MRRIKTDKYNADTYSSRDMLYRHELVPEVEMSKGLTRLYGHDSKMFPLLTLAEGDRGIVGKKRLLDDSRYTWRTIGRLIETSAVVGLVNTNNTKPGLGYSTFEVDFEDRKFIINHTVYTPDKQNIVYIHNDGVKQSNGKWRYIMSIFAGGPDDFVELGNFVAGTSWVQAAPYVAEKFSDSNRSNVKMPSKWTNQYSYHRFTKLIAGNIANQVVSFEVDAMTADGGKTKTNMWMPLEMEQFEIAKRIKLEDQFWNSKYNRDANGVIHDTDPETGEPLPSGAGVKETLISTDQYDTYGGVLPISKLDSIINRLYVNRVDDTPMELVLYTGSGGIQMFNEAIKNKAFNSQYYDKLGHEEIMSGKDGYLNYGKYFRQYTTVHGHRITVKEAAIFDKGPMAEMDKANGRVLNQLPHESYNMILLDHSRTEGDERNIEIVGEKGRENITGIYKGLTPLPTEWKVDSNLLSGTKDKATYEVMVSQGIHIKNYTTSFYLQYVD